MGSEARMKFFDIKGVHWKVWFLGDGSRKKQYIGEIA